MKVLSARNNKPGSWLICAATLGKWSHSAILLDGCIVIDSTLRTGVRRIDFTEWRQHYPTFELHTVDLPDEDSAIRFAESQVGKPYDWTALGGILMQRDWQEADSWFCSELVEATLAAGGKQRFRDSVSRITPHQSWAVL